MSYQSYITTVFLNACFISGIFCSDNGFINDFFARFPNSPLYTRNYALTEGAGTEEGVARGGKSKGEFYGVWGDIIGTDWINEVSGYEATTLLKMNINEPVG